MQSRSCRSTTLAVLALLAPHGLLAQEPTPAPAWDPTTIDPVPVDADYPPALAPISLEVAGSRVGATLYLADGPGPHATVIFLPDVPAVEYDSDMAQAARRAGYNALLLRYRGTGGSGGEFTWEGAAADATAAIDWVASGEAADRYRADGERIHLVGAGFGLWAGLMAAEQRPVIECIVALAPYDPAVVGRQLSDGGGSATATAWGWRTSLVEAAAEGGSIDADGDALLAALIDDPDRHGLARAAPGVRDNMVMMLTSASAEADPASQLLMTAARFASAQAASVERLIINDDRHFSASRVRTTRSVVQWLESRCPAW